MKKEPVRLPIHLLCIESKLSNLIVTALQGKKAAVVPWGCQNFKNLVSVMESFDQ